MSATASRHVPSAPRLRTRVLSGLIGSTIAASAVLLAAPAASATTPATARVPSARTLPAATTDAVSRIPVSFTVRNVNRSDYACPSDGKTYTVRGHLVGPGARLAGSSPPSAVSLYLHGLAFGQFFWRFSQVTGVSDYDYAGTLARDGQTSVIIDRLGYSSSDKPDGNQICAGSRADIAHQIVGQLRAGSYHVDGRSAPQFNRVALAGHSYGGQIAELEASSFGDIDALAVISYTDQGSSALAAQALAHSIRACAAGGMPVAPGGAAHYASYGNPANAVALVFNDTDPAVRAAALPLLSLDPCGDLTPFAKVAAFELTQLDKIHVPVLVISGGADALFPASAGDRQAKLFVNSTQVTRRVVPEAAHAITLERTRNLFAADVRTWLATTPVAASPTGSVATGVGDPGYQRSGLLGLGAAALAAAVGAGLAALRRSGRGRARH